MPSPRSCARFVCAISAASSSSTSSTWTSARIARSVLIALEEELKKDRAPSKVLQFNDFGLVAITRKRVKQSLERTLSTTCAICQGTGMVKSPVTVCNEIFIELRKMHRHLEKGDIMLRVNPEVVKQLKSAGGKWLQEMEEMSGQDDPGQDRSEPASGAVRHPLK